MLENLIGSYRAESDSPESYYLLKETFLNHFYLIATKYPNQIALHYIEKNNSSHTISYQDLKTKISNYVEYLLLKGVSKSAFIGIYMPVSIELYAMIFALWHIGAVYVPLSVNIDDQNLKYRIEDSGVKLIITKTECQEKLSQFFEGPVLYPSNATQVTSEKSSGDPPVTDTDIPAYLIYTSGTTSRSKGIVISHSALLSRWFSHWKSLSIKTNDRVGNFFDVHTDPSIMELLLAFGSGASLCIAEKSRLEHISNFHTFINELNVSIVITPPTFLKERAPWLKKHPHYFDSLRCIISATEGVTPDILTTWQQRSPGLTPRITANGYGGTETTIGILLSHFYPGDQHVVLGTKDNSFFGSMVYILPSDSDKLHDVDKYNGEGELCVGGIGLGRYWQDGEYNDTLNKRSYLNIPHTNGHSIFVFRSGDKIAVADGVMRFLSRLDRQLKIAGNRIEPEFIELLLCRHPNIIKAKIIEANNRLVAIFSVTDTKEIPSAKELIQLISTTPSNKNADTPSAFYWVASSDDLKSITDTSDIKLNKIPTESITSPESENFQAEKFVQNLWETHFGRQIDIHADFFEEGGYSLLLITLIEEIHEEYKIDLPFYLLPKRITIRKLANLIILIQFYQGSFKQINTFTSQPCTLVCFPPISGGAEKQYRQFSQQIVGARIFLQKTPPLNILEEAGTTTLAQPYVKYVFPRMSLNLLAKINCFILLNQLTQDSIHLLGWSYGGQVAYVTAHYLQLHAPSQYKTIHILDSLPLDGPAKLTLEDHYSRTMKIVNAIARDCGIDQLKLENYSDKFPGDEKIEDHIIFIFSEILKFVEKQLSLDKKDLLLKAHSVLTTTQHNFLLSSKHKPTKKYNVDNVTLYIAGETGALGRECLTSSWDKTVNMETFREQTIPDTSHDTILFSPIIPQVLNCKIKPQLASKKISNIQQYNISTYFPRDTQDKIKTAFSESKELLLIGPYGVGKKTESLAYGYSKTDDYDIVWVINAECGDTGILRSFRDLALKLELDTESKDEKEIYSLVKDHLVKSSLSRLFIYLDYDKSNYYEDYTIPVNCRDKKEQFNLFTSTTPHLKRKMLYIDPFSDKEVKDFFCKKIPDNLHASIEKIIAYSSAASSNMPLLLEVILAQISSRHLDISTLPSKESFSGLNSIDTQRVELMKKLIVSAKEKNIVSLNYLHWFLMLSPGVIKLELFYKFFCKEKQDEINNCITTLEHVGLILFNKEESSIRVPLAAALNQITIADFLKATIADKLYLQNIDELIQAFNKYFLFDKGDSMTWSFSYDFCGEVHRILQYFVTYATKDVDLDCFSNAILLFNKLALVYFNQSMSHNMHEVLTLLRQLLFDKLEIQEFFRISSQDIILLSARDDAEEVFINKLKRSAIISADTSLLATGLAEFFDIVNKYVSSNLTLNDESRKLQSISSEIVSELRAVVENPEEYNATFIRYKQNLATIHINLKQYNDSFRSFEIISHILLGMRPLQKHDRYLTGKIKINYARAIMAYFQQDQTHINDSLMEKLLQTTTEAREIFSSDTSINPQDTVRAYILSSNYSLFLHARTSEEKLLIDAKGYSRHALKVLETQESQTPSLLLQIYITLAEVKGKLQKGNAQKYLDLATAIIVSLPKDAKFTQEKADEITQVQTYLTTTP